MIEWHGSSPVSFRPVWLVIGASALILGAATILQPLVHVVFSAETYLPIHTLAEIASVAVSFAVFALYWSAAREARDGRGVFIGTAFLAVALIDAMHMLSFPGMPDFVTASSTNKGILYWLAARLWAAVALLAAAFLQPQSQSPFLRRGPLLALNLALVAAAFGLVSFLPDVLPSMFVPGQGLTPLKIGLEYVVAGLSVAAAVVYARAYRAHGDRFFQLLAMALVVTVFSELSFTLYASAYDLFNLLGHVYKVVAYALIFEALFTSAVRRPYEEVRALNAHLEQRVAERTAQLKGAFEEMEAFNYSVSHDLRSPLRALAGYSGILMEDHASQLEPPAQRYLQLIADNARRMGELIDDLLTFSRLSRQPLAKQGVHPADLVREALDGLRAEQEGRRVDVAIQELPPCQGDPALLRQVFANLLANSLKFTRAREVAVIEVGCRAEGGELAYFVRDNGVGFDMEHARKLFGVFQRLHRAEEYEGTGVGLAIVQRIVHRHGGRVWAKAEVGRGATFWFTLCGAGARAGE